MTRDIVAHVRENTEFLPGVFRMTLEADADFVRDAAPGRFVQVEVSRADFPLLRRPFTVSRRCGDAFEIVFEVRGRGTGILAGRREGDSLHVLGPLGRGYSLVPGRWLLIGGGMGAAGFPELAASVDCGLVLTGAASAERLLRVDGFPSSYATEDGSLGIRGLVTDLLDEVRWEDYSGVALCGPVAMMRAVVARMPGDIAGITQVSTEARMGCGWGACEGCVIPSAEGGYLKCCTDGPVVPALSIDWDLWEGIG